eukprot:1712405-Prymnesium_polylepis.1
MCAAAHAARAPIVAAASPPHARRGAQSCGGRRRRAASDPRRPPARSPPTRRRSLFLWVRAGGDHGPQVWQGVHRGHRVEAGGRAGCGARAVPRDEGGAGEARR